MVAIAFQPVRRWANHLANRLVYGKRANPYEVLARFADRIGDTYASEDVIGRIAQWRAREVQNAFLENRVKGQEPQRELTDFQRGLEKAICGILDAR